MVGAERRTAIKVRVAGTPQRGAPAKQVLSTTSALYQEPVWSPDGTRIVAIRSPAEQYVDETTRGESEFVWVPASWRQGHA